MKRTIRVEQKHIDKGESGNCKKCPVALAIAEQTEYKGARVLGKYFRPLKNRNDETLKVVYLPKEVANWITDFDFKCTFLSAKSKLEPFTFEFEDECTPTENQNGN